MQYNGLCARAKEIAQYECHNSWLPQFCDLMIGSSSVILRDYKYVTSKNEYASILTAPKGNTFCSTQKFECKMRLKILKQTWATKKANISFLTPALLCITQLPMLNTMTLKLKIRESKVPFPFSPSLSITKLKVQNMVECTQDQELK